MYKITDELDAAGFSINTIEALVKRNNNKFSFSTLEYFVIYVAYTDATLTVDGCKFRVPSNHLAYIAPFKNITYDTESLHNTVVVFSSSFYEKSVKDGFILNSDLFFNSDTDVFIAPSIGSGEEMKKLIVGRLGLYHHKAKGLYIAVAHNCVEILLLDGLLKIEGQPKSKTKINFSYLDIVNRFRVLLQKYFKKEKGVQFYSDQLGITPQRLSVMTELILGQGAKKIILEKLVNEAVKMLKYSTMNISEIASDLGFADEGNFSTFIKKHYDKTPTEIRGSSEINV